MGRGAVPSFRTGIHSGRVVAGEIGDRRKQIVFVGDVVNTASRVQAEAKARDKVCTRQRAFLSGPLPKVSANCFAFGGLNRVYSYRSASMGDRREALRAG